MPIYEFRCRECGERFSEFYRTVRQAEAATVRCPACDSADVYRLVSRVAVRTGELRAPAEETAPAEEKPPIFGRKELQEALKQREMWKQEAEAGE